MRGWGSVYRIRLEGGGGGHKQGGNLYPIRKGGRSNSFQWRAQHLIKRRWEGVQSLSNERENGTGKRGGGYMCITDLDFRKRSERKN